MVDEADKAPIHVTAILRNIVGGESITLADGRKIVPAACESNLSVVKLLLICSSVHSFANRLLFTYSN